MDDLGSNYSAPHSSSPTFHASYVIGRGISKIIKEVGISIDDPQPVRSRRQKAESSAVRREGAEGLRLRARQCVRERGSVVASKGEAVELGELKRCVVTIDVHPVLRGRVCTCKRRCDARKCCAQCQWDLGRVNDRDRPSDAATRACDPV